MSLALMGVPVLGCVDYRPQWFYPRHGLFRAAVPVLLRHRECALCLLAPSSTQENIPLMIETGSRFMWRGVRLNLDRNGGMPVTLLVRFF